MSRPRLVVRRAAAQRGLLLTIAALVLVVAAALGATLGQVRAAATQGARDGVLAAEPDARSLHVTTRLADDAATQDAHVRDAVARLTPGVPVDVTRTLRSDPVAAEQVVDGAPVALEGAERVVLDAGGDDGTLPGGTLVDGAWPAGPGEGALQADAAEALGLGVGDELVLGRDPAADGTSGREPTGTADDAGTRVRLVGTWRAAPADPGEEARWAGDALALTGQDGSAVGPLVLTPDALTALDDAAFVRWAVVPQAERLRPQDLPVLADGAAALRGALRTDDAVAVRGLAVAGDLGTTARQTADALEAARAVTLVPVGLLALVSLIALVQVARLLAQVREGEVALAVARGAAPRQLAVAATAEGLVLGVAGAVVGSGLAAAGLVLAGGSGGSGGSGGTGAASLVSGGLVTVLVATAAGTTAVVAAVLGGVAGLQVRRVARRTATDRSGRGRTAAAWTTVVLAVALAALCLWQLRRYGSPLVATPAGPRTDVLAALAPAAVLAALAVLALAVLGPAARAWQGVAARGRRLVGVLAARQVSRRLAVLAVPVVLVVLAAGSATVVGLYAGTSAGLRADVDRLRAGADVRVELPATGAAGAGAAAVVPSALAAATGAAAVVPGTTLGATAGEVPVVLAALPADRAADVVRAPAGVLDVDGLAGTLDGGAFPGAVPLPEGTTAVELDLAGSVAVDPEVAPTLLPEYLAWAEEGRALRTTLWFADDDGRLVSAAAPALGYDLDGDGAQPLGAAPTTTALRAAAPAGGPWRLVGVELGVNGTWVPLAVDVTVDGARALADDGAATPLDLGTEPWAPAPDLLGDADPGEPAGTIGYRGVVTDGGVTLRALPGTEDGPVPLVVSRSLADLLDLAPGQDLSLDLGGSTLPVVVAQVVDAVPGELAPYAALADLPTLDDRLLRTRDAVPAAGALWVAAPDPDDAAAVRALGAAVADALPDAARGPGGQPPEVSVAGARTGPDAAGPVRASGWLAAAGALVLALAGVLAVAVATVRARRGEVLVLRALGASPAEQARGRRTELLAVTAAAGVLGLVAGAAVAVLTVPDLARATLTGVDAVLPVTLRLAVPGTLALLAALVAGLLLVAAVVGARVRAQARDTEYREEVR